MSEIGVLRGNGEGKWTVVRGSGESRGGKRGPSI